MSNVIAWSTVLGSLVATATAGLGLGILVAIVGTILVVVTAWHEEQDRARAIRRQALREAAWRELGGRERGR
jgi:hypothetical protein